MASLGGLLLAERANVIALLALAVAVALGLPAWLSNRVSALERRLERNPKERKRKADVLLQPGRVALYRAGLVAALDRLDRWMGPPEAWGRGFNWCLAAGLAYSYGFVLLAWVLGAPATLGELTILPDPAVVPAWGRLLLACSIGGVVVLVYLAFRHGERIDARLDAALAARLPHGMGPERRQTTAVWLRRGLTAALLFAVLRFGLDFSLLTAVAVAVAGAGAVAGAVAVAGAAAASLGYADPGRAARVATSFALFAVLLPLLNAVFDWLSLLASRWLGRDLAAGLDPDGAGGWRRLGAFAGHVAADLALAVGTLVGLAWSIPRAIGVFNDGLRWLGLPAPLALGDYLCGAARDPLGQGLWASLMLFSTLAPTAIHLAFLLAAPFAWSLSRSEVWQARARHLLGKGPPPPADLSDDEREAGAWTTPARGTGTALCPETVEQVARHFARVRPLLLCATSLLAVLLIGLVLWAAFASWEPLPEFLLWVATGDAAAVVECFGPG